MSATVNEGTIEDSLIVGSWLLTPVVLNNINTVEQRCHVLWPSKSPYIIMNLSLVRINPFTHLLCSDHERKGNKWFFGGGGVFAAVAGKGAFSTSKRLKLL